MPITNIKEQFKKVIQYSQLIEEPKVDKLFDMWLDAKRDIIEAWDGKFIFEVPGQVSFDLDAEEKTSRLNEFIDVVYNIYQNEDLGQFLEWASIDEIFSNKLKRDFPLDGCNKIAAGTRVIKAFKYFENNEQLLRELQDRLSMILQEDKVVGTLCFSVHPLDFLSASENHYHWRSCHALDGDYRAGNLSYLLDKNTIICYLKKQGEMVKLPHFPEDVPWNSKKWRMWIFLSDKWDSIFAGRQYPFFSRSALDKIQMSLLTSIKKNYMFWSEWHDDCITTFNRNNKEARSFEGDLDGRHIAMRYNVYKMKDLVTDCDNPLHFNDLLQSSYYIPYYCWERGNAGKANIHFSIGNSVPCLCCNGKNNLQRSNSMMCDPCELEFGEGQNDYFAYCDHCDTRQIRDDMIWIESASELICQDCYNEYIKRCDKCGYDWYRTDLARDKFNMVWLCPYCQRGENAKDMIEIDNSWYELLPF